MPGGDRTGLTGMANWPTAEQAASPSESDIDPAKALAFREDQMRSLELQRHEIEQRIRGLETDRWQRNNDCGQL